jgi:hypothetical protein
MSSIRSILNKWGRLAKTQPVKCDSSKRCRLLEKKKTKGFLKDLARIQKKVLYLLRDNDRTMLKKHPGDFEAVSKCAREALADFWDGTQVEFQGDDINARRILLKYSPDHRVVSNTDHFSRSFLGVLFRSAIASVAGFLYLINTPFILMHEAYTSSQRAWWRMPIGLAFRGPAIALIGRRSGWGWLSREKTQDQDFLRWGALGCAQRVFSAFHKQSAQEIVDAVPKAVRTTMQLQRILHVAQKCGHVVQFTT